MKTYIKILTFTSALVLILSGCGGGSSSPTTPPTITGQFIDEKVQGLVYTCTSGKVGVTNSNGDYTCNVGDHVTFKVGDTTIGTLAAQSDFFTPYSFYPTSLDASLNLASLLQSLDSNGDANNGTIVIDIALAANLPTDTDFASPTFRVDTELALGITLISQSEAQRNLNKNIEDNGGTVPIIKTYNLQLLTTESINFVVASKDSDGAESIGAVRSINNGIKQINSISVVEMDWSLLLKHTTNGSVSSEIWKDYYNTNGVLTFTSSSTGVSCQIISTPSPMPINAGIGASGEVNKYACSDNKSFESRWSLTDAGNNNAFLTWTITSIDATNTVVSTQTDKLTINSQSTVIAMNTTLEYPSSDYTISLNTTTKVTEANFINQYDLLKSQIVMSNEITIDTIEVTDTITASINQGSILLNGIDTSSQSIQVNGGDKVAIKVTTSNTFLTTKTVQLNLGYTTRNFLVQTIDKYAEDTFNTQSNLKLGENVTSNSITIVSLPEGDTSIATITAGTIILNGADSGSKSVSIKKDDTIAFTTKAASILNTNINVVLNLGYTTRTFALSTIPTALEGDFISITDASPSQNYISNKITINSLADNQTQSISCDIGTLVVNDIETGNTTALVLGGDEISVKIDALSFFDATIKSTLDLGYLTKSYEIETKIISEQWIKQYGTSGREVPIGLELFENNEALLVYRDTTTVTFSVIDNYGSQSILFTKPRHNASQYAGLIIDNDDNILIAGEYTDTNSSKVGFIDKYTKEGNSIWQKRFPSSYLSDIEFYNNEIYISRAMDKSPWTGYLEKFTIDGDMIWSYDIGNVNPSNIPIAVDSANNILAMYPGKNVRKYDDNGSLIWTQLIEGRGLKILIDNSFLSTSSQTAEITKYNKDGNKVWTSSAADSFDVDKGNNIFLANNGAYSGSNLDYYIGSKQLNQYGIVQWSKNYNRIARGLYESSSLVKVDKYGSVFIVGIAEGLFGDSEYGDFDIFLIKYGD